MNSELGRLKSIVKKLPQRPGVYFYRDITGEIIYVGKAKSLRSRVGSYFNVKLDNTSKTAALVDRINDISYIEVGSEFEALILEAELIKKFQPYYNIALKDSKSYLYIVIKNEKVQLNGKSVLLPKVIAARKTMIEKTDTYFGPFPNAENVKKLIRTVRKIFGFRDCSITKFNRYNKLGSPCLYGHIGLCSGPCVNNSPELLKEYKKNVIKVKRIFSGASSELINDLRKNMEHSAKIKEYEKAANYRDLLKRFEYVRQNFYLPNDYIANPYLTDDLSRRSLEEIKSVLPFLDKLPERMECYDISNISGKEAVGSMVVATDGKIDKDQYRRFKIRFKNTPDDFDMLYEVIERRLKNDWELPDLLVVDGGKGQVSAAISAVEDAGFNIPVIGLAKKYETIVFKTDGNFQELRLENNNPGLLLLVRLRDESHRFAQKYHHHLMLKHLQ